MEETNDTLNLVTLIGDAVRQHNYEKANYLAAQLPLEYETVIYNIGKPNLCITIRQRLLQLPPHHTPDGHSLGGTA